MDNFNRDLENNAGKDISVSHNVELLNPSGSNPGDIAGLKLIEDQCIDAIAGFNNIPPFMFAKGKAGRMGGNANKEEIDSFLQTEVEPEQEMLEQVIERQFYDRILAIMFDLEPSDIVQAPVTLKHNFETPVIQTEIDPAQFEMLMQLVNAQVITLEDAMDKLGLRDILKEDSSTGGDVTPTEKIWPVTNSFNKQQMEMHTSKIELLNLAKQAIKTNNVTQEKEQRSKGRTAV